MAAEHRNRLAGETSPYLLQHAANPVDWFPWGEEAFARARADDKPILLSVGYSACHWCHVMAHESFEDEAIAAQMNEGFVNIKVDREERPDVDSVYMTATQALAAQGGWPMTVFMTAEGKPFYAGTYYPPSDMHGRPGFPRLLRAIRSAWDGDRTNLLASADSITAQLRNATGARSTAGDAPGPGALQRAVEALESAFDPEWGGFGRAPRFPAPSTLEFLLAHSVLESGPTATTARDMALHTLRQMAGGGMYDQLGGGFARYSVDGEWLIPHFEKMLYDNAQLARLYLYAWQLTGESEFERIARETLDYLARDMRDPGGGFYAAEDADSEGIEGKFYVWTVDEVRDALGEDAPDFLLWFGVTEAGNFQDPHHPEFGRRNVLTFRTSRPVLAAHLGVPLDEFEARIESMRARLLALRAERVRPGLDDKVLASWNGLALAAFAEAARILDDARYRDLAEANAAFLRSGMWRDGRLLHTWKAGAAKVDGLLEDYAYVGLGLVSLYRLTGNLDTLTWAGELFAQLLDRFRDSEGGGFFETPADGEALLLRQKPFFDAATPGGNPAAAQLGWWLGRYYARREWEDLLPEVAALVAAQLDAAPSGFGSLLLAMQLAFAPHREVVVIGPPVARLPFERILAARYAPATVIAPAAEGGGLPLLEARGGADVLGYVCHDMVCQLPASTSEEFARQLD